MKDNDESTDNETTTSGLTVTKEKTTGCRRNKTNKWKIRRTNMTMTQQHHDLRSERGGGGGVEYNKEAQENTAHNKDNKTTASGLIVQ